MRLQESKSTNASSFYVVKSVYENGKRTNKIVETLGTKKELETAHPDCDIYEWAKAYVAELTKKEKEGKSPPIMVKYAPNKLIPKDEQQSYCGGYLFLDKIYHELGLHKICAKIKSGRKFEYDLNNILRSLLFGRILFPLSKKATCEYSENFLEPMNFELHQVYRALEVIAKENDNIQSAVYKNSVDTVKRNTGVLFYDCTNFFFEIEEEDGIKKYGHSKENRPNPIVQLGLFMDGSGIPLAFVIFSGEKNEQPTLKPLEQKILDDFGLSRFIVCTDAGLSSMENRVFNDTLNRAFITTQSIKKLNKPMMKWALDPKGWQLSGDRSGKLYDLSKIDEETHSDSIFYKDTWETQTVTTTTKFGESVKKKLEQRYIVTFSIKYRKYQRTIREGQIERARKLVHAGKVKLSKVNANDSRRFIKKVSVTKDGEVADQDSYYIDDSVIAEEEKFDGFYGVCTNLEDSVEEIIKVNRGRWEIEESFRIMKSEFKARPSYLSRDDRIEAHFATCFLALLIYRILEKKLGEKYTCPEIIKQLRDMNFVKVKEEGFAPTYTRTDFTDDLHAAFGFNTDYEILTKKTLKNIFKVSKST